MVDNRLKSLNGQFSKEAKVSQETITVDDQTYAQIVDFAPHRKVKTDYINKQGWGYADTSFSYEKDKDNVFVEGSRYLYSGEYLPNLIPYVEKEFGIDKTQQSPKQELVPCNPPILNHAFIKDLGESFSRRSLEHWDRVMHSHGSSFQEVHNLRNASFKRNADLVVYPGCHEHCENLVKLACKHNVVLVPYGAGTNVTQSLLLEESEKRMIVSIDMCRMNKIKWIDKENRMALVEAGIYGIDLERELMQQGVVTGHEPDSHEFSTLGGWISTRASGMKKNTYGNIEDIVQNITLVTPSGTYTKKSLWPRVSNGPDINHVVMGSEGNLGIITEAVVRVRPIPEKKEFGSIIFPDFETGIKFMAEMAKLSKYPTSIRLVDNTQFTLGHALKPETKSAITKFIDSIKTYYVVNIAGYNPEKLAAVTLLFEGDADEVDALSKKTYSIAKKYHGMAAGAENGIKGYTLTYLIAYIRDFACEFYIAAESFETSCPWSCVPKLCKNVKQRIVSEGVKLGFAEQHIWVSFRVTQLYETGAAVYVYFTLNYQQKGIDKAVICYETVEHAARDEVMACGGSLSHHHGIGKLRKHFMSNVVPDMALEWQKSFKEAVDPQNIFAINNTIFRSEEEKNKASGH